MMKSRYTQRFVALLVYCTCVLAADTCSASSYRLAKRDGSQSCSADAQCSVFSPSRTKRRLGDYACINGSCQYLVKAGELCSSASDCAAFQLSSRWQNISLADSHSAVEQKWCAPEFCTLESTCGGAWTLPKAPYKAPPGADANAGSMSCCRGFDLNAQCGVYGGTVDTCSSDLVCSTGNSKPDTAALGKCVSPEPRHQVWIGVLLVLVGGATLNIGLNLQKYAFRKRQEKQAASSAKSAEHCSSSTPPRSVSADHISRQSLDISVADTMGRASTNQPCSKYAKWLQSTLNPIWLLGLGIFVVGNVINFIALQFAPQSLVAPLGAVSLVTNVVVAPLLNNEKIGWFDIGGIALIIAGCVIVVVFSGIVQQNYRLCMLVQLLKARPTVVYLCIISAAIICTYSFLWIVEQGVRRSTAGIDAAGNSQIRQSRATRLIPPISSASRYVRYGLPLAYASLGSFMAALTTLFAKTLVNLLSVSLFDHDNQFTSFLPWAILLITVFTAASQVYWINQGLLRYDALLQVPVFYVVWTVLDIIGGGIYFNEFKAFTAVKYVLFVLGVLVIFSGVSLLANRLKASY
ncbi:magnesium transporter NIPA-domain-containing protein [Coemansia mojavensis]|nr:magnesium transporter NIPA-domain-containing protein [Coemansia mojavensis]KAI9469378.1 magnesium transporter NIPA-domain-containing protein [Coemansia mojavensis]